jgi:CheY-like chemotaxis protein
MGLLRALPPLAQVPIVFVTARCRRSDVDSLLALGATGVISKPFDPLTLAKEVVAQLARAGHDGGDPQTPGPAGPAPAVAAR